MPSLADKLRAEVAPVSATEKDEWKAVLQQLDGNVDLEHALDEVKGDAMLKRVVAVSGQFVSELDRKWGWPIATGAKTAPLTPLLKSLTAGLPSSYPIQHVVTPNYDMLIEHTCGALQLPWIDGFAPGATSVRDWRYAGFSMLNQEEESRGRRVELVTRIRAHVRLHKVHGSINWFCNDGGTRLLRCDAATYQEPCAGWLRAMITPGQMKNQQIALNRDWFAESDKAIQGGSAFLIVGYGFNDDHIQKGIRGKLQNEGCSGIIVTRDWSPVIEEWVKSCSDLWAVCKSTTGTAGGTMIIGPSNVDDPLICPDEDLWKIDVFANSVM